MNDDIEQDDTLRYDTADQVFVWQGGPNIRVHERQAHDIHGDCAPVTASINVWDAGLGKVSIPYTLDALILAAMEWAEHEDDKEED